MEKRKRQIDRQIFLRLLVQRCSWFYTLKMWVIRVSPHGIDLQSLKEKMMWGQKKPTVHLREVMNAKCVPVGSPSSF